MGYLGRICARDPIEGTKAQRYLEERGLKDRDQKGYLSFEQDGKSFLVVPKTLMTEIKSASVFEIKGETGKLTASIAVQTNEQGIAEVKKGVGIGGNYVFDTLDEALKESKGLKRANVFVVTKPQMLEETMVKMIKTRELTVITSSKQTQKDLEGVQSRKLKVCPYPEVLSRESSYIKNKEIEQEI